jgi:hypothetical protein
VNRVRMLLSHTYRRVKSKIIYVLRIEQRLRHWDDARYLRLLFRVRMGRRLDLRNPRTFSEKLQWLKLHDRQPVYSTMVDKYDVKQWVSERIGSSYVVPNLGVWNSFDAIEFDVLPEQFVLKCTHDSGGLVICKDRAAFDMHAARSKIENSLARNYHYLGREWPYRDVKPRVLAEVYLPTWVPENVKVDADALQRVSQQAEAGMIDYKFYCFHGEPKFLYVSQGLHDHQTAKMIFLTCDWKPAGFARPDYHHFDELPSQPASLNEMLSVARKLAAGIPFVRVDLFEHFGRVLFSELTFHPVSGMMPVEPKSADVDIGRFLHLSRVEVTP